MNPERPSIEPRLTTSNNPKIGEGENRLKVDKIASNAHKIELRLGTTTSKLKITALLHEIRTQKLI